MINLKYPPVIHWEVTPECSHNCIHCYNYWRKDKNLCSEFNKTKEYYLKMAKSIAKQKPTLVVITRWRAFFSF